MIIVTIDDGGGHRKKAIPVDSINHISELFTDSCNPEKSAIYFEEDSTIRTMRVMETIEEIVEMVKQTKLPFQSILP